MAKQPTAYTWKVEITVSSDLVADGLELNQWRLHTLLLKALGHVRSDELQVTVLEAPEDEALATEMGYQTVAAWKERRG